MTTEVKRRDANWDIFESENCITRDKNWSMDKNATEVSILGIWGNGNDIYQGIGVDYNISSVLTC